MTDETTFDAHPSAVIDEGASIGDDTRVWHFSHISGGARVGSGCTLGQNCYVADRVVIGDGVKIQNNVSVFDRVEIGDDVFVGPSVVFTNVVNPRAHVPRKDEYLPTHVARGATLGANCTIVCGNDIGEFAFVGAGAVVTRDVPAYALVVGNPARRVGWMCACGDELRFSHAATEATCSECGARYVNDGDGVRPAGED
jgi:UDP-2-acetamido-3-amino-2,3-dideoxy-glucuronate N-acetyltransferase